MLSSPQDALVASQATTIDCLIARSGERGQCVLGERWNWKVWGKGQTAAWKGYWWNSSSAQASHSCDLWLKEKHLCNNTSHFLCNSCTLQFFLVSQMASLARNTFHQLSILADTRFILITSCCPSFDCVSTPCYAEAFVPAIWSVQTHNPSAFQSSPPHTSQMQS